MIITITLALVLFDMLFLNLGVLDKNIRNSFGFRFTKFILCFFITLGFILNAFLVPAAVGTLTAFCKSFGLL